MKTLVVCIDGTWNAPGQVDYDPLVSEQHVTETNVAIVWRALTRKQLDEQRPYGSMQEFRTGSGLALYLNGVGTEGSATDETISGLSGTGTSERIKDAYRFLAERWETGDALFFFGFSRAAFAVRSLAGLIEKIGLPREPQYLRERELNGLYDEYRNGSSSLKRWAVPATVTFLGLWDTVGALALGKTANAYHSVSPANVSHVAHALAINERRTQFLPVFYRSSEGQLVEEVWFNGAHSNIGGGYFETDLSNIALFWVLGRAVKAGLMTTLDRIAGWDKESYVFAPGRPSYGEFWSSKGLLGKLIVGMRLFHGARQIISGQKVHQSVVDAIAAGLNPDIAIPADTGVEPWGFDEEDPFWRNHESKVLDLETKWFRREWADCPLCVDGMINGNRCHGEKCIDGKILPA